MAETDPKSVQDLTNVVSRDREASVSWSSLAEVLIASSILSKKVTSLQQFGGISLIDTATLVRVHV